MEIKKIKSGRDNLLDRHFPNMMHGWNSYANDNEKEQDNAKT